MIMVTPGLACPAGTPCSENAIKGPYKEITGVERDANIAFALNLKDVQKLSENHLSTTNVKQIEDSAKVYSIENNMTNGSIETATAVIIPVEFTGENNKSVQITNVIAVWNGKYASPKVMSATYTFNDKKTDTVIFSRVDDNDEIVSSTVISNGSIVKDINSSESGFFAATRGTFSWDCVRNVIIDDCACEVLQLPCPPTLPSICGFCLELLTPCWYVMSPVTCGPAAICMGLELALAINSCTN